MMQRATKRWGLCLALVGALMTSSALMMRRATKRWGAFSAVLAAGLGPLAVRADEPPDLPRGEIARRGREATAFLEVGPGRSATAFCVHPSGLFVTNDHVIQN